MSSPGRLGFTTYLLLGLRNLRRNPRRTGIALASLIVGIAALTFLGALNDGWLQQMKTNFILTLTGHVQVHAKGFQASQNIRDYMHDPRQVIALVRKDPDVVSWTGRLRSSGLAAVAAASTGVQIMGVDPEQEARVTRMHECIDRGRWLAPNDPKGVLLGGTLAENLGVKVGGRVVLMAQRPGGDMASDVFYLRGVLCPNGPRVDRMLAVIALATAQKWLGVGGGLTDVVVRADAHNAAAAIKRRLLQALPPERYEVMAWQDLDPMVRQWLEFSDAYSLVVIFVVVALVLAEILNTMLMALHERTRELGMLEALGTRKVQLFLMMLIEGVILVMLGAIAGYLLGAGAVLYYGDAGIDLTHFADAFKFFYMSPIIRPVLTSGSAMEIMGTTLAAAVLAGLYPAWKATHLEPSEALRRV